MPSQWEDGAFKCFCFPEENYLCACGPCNGPKNNRFAVFSADGQAVDVARRLGAPVIPPSTGDPLLIDPRTDDPFTFIELDLLGTFLFLPSAEEDSRSALRAAYTIDLLGLNRDMLKQARGEAYESYGARLDRYIHHRDAGAPQVQLDRFTSAIQRMGHPTVWREMQRQAALIPDLRTLFDHAPEALAW